MNETLMERVFSRVAIAESGCWEWQASCQSGGYGQLMVGRKMWTAHRAAWTAWHGPIPHGLWVLHRCDNRRCVRPDHLYLGTNADNMRDAVDRGRIHRPWDRVECKRGHAVPGGGRCAECRRLTNRLRYHARKVG